MPLATSTAVMMELATRRSQSCVVSCFLRSGDAHVLPLFRVLRGARARWLSITSGIDALLMIIMIVILASYPKEKHMI